MIHFKFCLEEKWYPCHRCHNAAVALTGNPNDNAEDKEGPSDHIVRKNMVREISDIPEAGISHKAEGNSEHEGTSPQDRYNLTDIVLQMNNYN